MRELPELHMHCIALGRVPCMATGAILTASHMDKPHLVVLPILLRFQKHSLLVFSFCRWLFLFHIHFILLFKKVLGQFSSERAAIHLFRTFCHSWLPGLTDGSCFVKLSFSELPHPTKRADPESCWYSSLRLALLYFCCFPWRWSDLQGLGTVTFGVRSRQQWLTCNITDFFWKHVPVRHRLPRKAYLPCASGTNLLS